MGTLTLIKGDMLPGPKKQRGLGGKIFFSLFGGFLLFASPLHALTISGFVLDLGGNPVPNIEIHLVGVGPVQDVSSSSGYYSVAGLVSGGTYTVYAFDADLVFTPSSHTYVNLTTYKSDENFIFGKVWSGGGGDNFASNPNNWVGDEAPLPKDAVLFSSTGSAKSCLWDLTVSIASFTIAVDYSSAVIATANMDLNNLLIAGARLEFGSLDHTLSGNFNQTGGTFTFGSSGRVNFDGNSPQTIHMLISEQGLGIYGSYFSSVWIKNSSPVTLTTDLIVDGSFVVSTGAEFDPANSTITVTGGRMTGDGLGFAFNWDDSGGIFHPGTGLVHFFNYPRNYHINRGASSSFNNLTIDGDGGADLLSDNKVMGSLQVGNPSRTSQFDTGSSHQMEVFGPVNIGPASNPASTTMTLGSGNAIFHGNVTIGTATVSITNSNILFQGDLLNIAGQGTLRNQSGSLTTVSFKDASVFQVSGGTFSSNAPLIFTSTAPGITHFSTQINGVFDNRQSMTLSSLDVNGLRFGPRSKPVNLVSLSFTNGISGGAALNFDPVTLASITVSNPNFNASISTHVRAVLDSAVLPLGFVNIRDPVVFPAGVYKENDPSGIINWGILGTPYGFSGTAVGASSITWTWSFTNDPLGFVVKSATGNLSGLLLPNTTSWTETGLSTNTQYTRHVEAFVDIGSATSNSAPKFTFAVPVTTVTFSNVYITSVTITWGPNTNSTHTIFLVERSPNGTSFVTVGSGTYASIHPFSATGLTQLTEYYFRVKSKNGDGIIVPQVSIISTTTLPVPPPVVDSITPNTWPNLGSVSFTVRGRNFRPGATLVLRRSTTQIIIPTPLNLVDPSTFTGTVNLLGALAAPWDVFLTNLDGTQSTGSVQGIFTVTNADSQGSITIKDYISSLPLNFFTTDNKSELRVPAGAMGNGRFYVSANPIIEPLQIDPAAIVSAAAASASTGWIIVPGTIREMAAFETTGIHSGGFNKEISLTIYYPDANNDGIVDSVPLRATSLRMMTLNSGTGRWEPVSGSNVDPAKKYVTAAVDHFSVYALFCSPTGSDLSGVKIYPNPWQPGSGTKFDNNDIIFSDLTEEGTIRIYTLDAGLVRSIDFSISDAGIVHWDGKNGRGQNAASGIYLIHIESGKGEKKIFKLGIER